MALPNGAGGYQVGDGNVNDPIIDLIAVPVSITTAQTLTPAQVLNGLIITNSGLTAASVTYTLPTVTDLENTLINSDRIGTTFTFRVINIGTSSATAIIAAGAGWTITGSLTMTIPVTTGAMFIARKSAAGAWTLYRAN